MADPNSAQEQRDQMRQQQQGQSGYGQGSDDFAQPGKENHATGTSQAEDAAFDANDSCGAGQAQQAAYGSSSEQRGGLNDDINSGPAIGGRQQSASESGNDGMDDEDETVDSTSGSSGAGSI